MPGEPQTVYLQRTYSEAEHDAIHTSRIVGVWTVDPAALTPITSGARSCPFHRQQSTTRERCAQCNSLTLLITYRYQTGAVNVLLVAGEIGTLVLDPELSTAAVPAALEVPAVPEVLKLPATPKRSRKREPVAAE